MKDNPVRVAILGAGSRGIEMLRACDALLECAIVGVSDANLSRLLYIREWFPHVAVLGDDESLLADETVEAVVVATSAASHAALAAAALATGKHVLVDGPLALQPALAEELVAAAAEAGRVLATGYEAVYQPAVAEMKSFLSLRGIGDLCYMESARLGLGPPEAAQNVTWELGAQDVAIALHLAGEPPARVTAVGGSFRRPGTVDAAFVTIQYGSGRFSQHHVSWLSQHPVQRFFVVGTEGSIVFSENRTADKVRVYQSAGPGQAPTSEVGGDALEFGPEGMSFPEQGSGSPMVRQCALFLEAVRGGRRSLVDGAAGRDVVRVLAAADRSMREGSAPVALG